MKKLIFIIFALIISVNLLKADSPITSSDIYKAYTDVDMVKYAKKVGKMDEKIANYLNTNDVTIDVKAAVINAIGWEVDGTENAESYSRIIFSMPLKKLDLSSLNSDDLFCIGYLQVMDDYYHPKEAIPYINKAKELNNKSFTVAIISSLIEAQALMNNQENWCKMWEIVYKVFDDKSIYNDMKDDARKIIWDYMIGYKCQ
jgi:hypothetical protein